jgi:hypothetical protein
MANATTRRPQALSQPPLKALAAKYRVRAVNDVPFTPLPLADQLADEDEAALKARTRQLSYEMPLSQWRGIPCQGEPAHPPRRFIDGSIFSRTVAVFTVDGRRRPAILASVGALALHLNGRRLERHPGSLRLETILCLISNGIPAEDVRTLAEGVEETGLRLVTSETTELTADFEVLRRRTWDLAKQRMENAERGVLLDDHEVPSVVDGLLERRLVTVTSQEMPVFGVVGLTACGFSRSAVCIARCNNGAMIAQPWAAQPSPLVTIPSRALQARET